MAVMEVDAAAVEAMEEEEGEGEMEAEAAAVLRELDGTEVCQG